VCLTDCVLHTRAIARSVGSFQAVKWLSRHILARWRAAVFHVHLTAFQLRIPTRWNLNMGCQRVGMPACWDASVLGCQRVGIPTCWDASVLGFQRVGGLGAKPSSEPYSALLFSSRGRRCVSACTLLPAGGTRLPSRPYSPAFQRGALGARVAPLGALFCPLGGLFFFFFQADASTRVTHAVLVVQFVLYL
jgi:hypothetical protein